MKLKNRNSLVQDSSGLDRSSAKINNLGKIFRLLEKLYSYPIRTLVQEYLSNAKDACAQYNLPVNIEVKLPTNTSPSFSVKDFGTGMTKDDILNVFFSYGNTTKDTENSAIGGFGIGGKSVFAYTDSFEVISTKEGKSCHIVGIKNGDMTEYVVVNEWENQAPNGTEIIVPLKQLEDIESFEKAYVRATFLWENRPKIISSRPEFNDFDTDAFMFPFKDIRFVDKNHLPLSNKPSIVFNIGGIPYSIDQFVSYDRKRDSSPSKEYYSLIDHFDGELSSLSCSLIVDVPIGIFEFSSSREEIELNDYNSKEVAKQLIKIRKQSLELIETFNSDNKINDLNNHIDWMSKEITSKKFTEVFVNGLKIEISRCEKSRYGYKNDYLKDEIISLFIKDFPLKIRNAFIHKNKVSISSDTLSSFCSLIKGSTKDLHIIINNDGSKIKELKAKITENNLLASRPNYKKTFKSSFIFRDNLIIIEKDDIDDSTISSLCELFTIHYSSELNWTKPEKIKKETKRRTKEEINLEKRTFNFSEIKLSFDQYSINKDSSIIKNFDFKDTYFVISNKIHGYTTQIDDLDLSLFELSLLSQFGYKICFISNSSYEKIKDVKDFKLLSDLTLDQIKKRLTPFKPNYLFRSNTNYSSYLLLKHKSKDFIKCFELLKEINEDKIFLGTSISSTTSLFCKIFNDDVLLLDKTIDHFKSDNPLLKTFFSYRANLSEYFIEQNSKVKDTEKYIDFLNVPYWNKANLEGNKFLTDLVKDCNIFLKGKYEFN